jgi:excinuclease ABC subunit C
MHNLISEKRKSLPSSPGVYIFKDEDGTPLYIGKATNLKSRVASYFSGHDSRGERIANMISQSVDISIRKTQSVLEAVILESNLIKRYQPKYNVDLKDGKSFAHIVVTKERFPRFLIVRETDMQSFADETVKQGMCGYSRSFHIARSYGPYTSKKQAETVLKLLRKIFPFHSSARKTENGCLYFHIGLCPGPYAGVISLLAYKKNIRNIEYVLRGKKTRLQSLLKREMEIASRLEEYERAGTLRDAVFALDHIRDVALLASAPKALANDRASVRIEGYDISNISGKFAVGSMVVFIGGIAEKKLYRKFSIQTVSGIDDVAMMREVLERRFRHTEWPFPDVLLLDGGKGHLNMAKRLLSNFRITEKVCLVALAKGPTRKKVELIWGTIECMKKNVDVPEAVFVSVRDEAHRFAVSYHRKLRRKGMSL